MDNELKKVGQDLVNTLNRIVIEKKKNIIYIIKAN